jgi:chromate reductase
MFTVAVVVGSLRKGSFNRKLALAVDKLKQDNLRFSLINIADIPLYNQDHEMELPPAVATLKKEIKEADAVLFVTPEYNRSIPGVLKNVIDWGTRPYGQNVWAGKPTGIIGTSPGGIGTAVAQSHLRSSLSAIGVPLLGFPEVYLVYKEDLIDDNYNITNPDTLKFLTSYLDRFNDWIKQNLA